MIHSKAISIVSTTVCAETFGWLPPNTALGTLAIPVVGVIAAWLQLGEVPGSAEAVGMILIVGGLAILAAHGLAAGRREPLHSGEEPDVRPVTD